MLRLFHFSLYGHIFLAVLHLDPGLMACRFSSSLNSIFPPPPLPSRSSKWSGSRMLPLLSFHSIPVPLFFEESPVP